MIIVEEVLKIVIEVKEDETRGIGGQERITGAADPRTDRCTKKVRMMSR